VAKTARKPVDVPVKASPDWLVAGFAAIGFAVSVYLTIVKLAGGSALFCEAGSGCDIVQASRWATFLGVPTAAWGAVVYAILAGLAIVGLTTQRWTWAFVLATGAVAFAGYLAWIELFVLRAICPWCVVVALAGVAVLITLLARRPAPRGRRASTRPARLATIGVVTAVVTIVVAAGVYVADTTGQGGYADAVARHLAKTGGVMYGAFW
jgi:uncharacterized membrane protein